MIRAATFHISNIHNLNIYYENAFTYKLLTESLPLLIDIYNLFSLFIVDAWSIYTLFFFYFVPSVIVYLALLPNFQ